MTSPATAHELSPQTLAALRRRLGSRQHAAGGGRIPRRSEPGPAPLSFAQQRLWFLEQLVPGRALYNLMAIQRFPVPVDAGLLERSLNMVVERHDILRTRFTVAHDQPVQVVMPDCRITLARFDLTTLAPDAREAEARRLADEECRRPFDLARPPLVRAALVLLEPADSIFLVNMHHIISDGWSLEVFWRELVQFYEAARLHQSAPLPELPIQYADFAVWQRRGLTGSVLEKQLEYWRGQLANLPPFQVPADRPRGSIQSFRGRYESLVLPASLAARLRTLSGGEGVTLFMTLLAAFKVLLSRYSGEEDTVVGSPIAGRTRVELEPLIGFFVNTVVLRTRLEGNPTFREALHRVEETALGAYAHQDLPFEMLVEKLQPDRDLGRNPLFQVMFQLLHRPGNAAADTKPAPLVQPDTAKFDLTCSLWDLGETIEGAIEYASDLFAPETVQRLVRHYQRLLEQVACAPDQRIRRIQFLDENERHDLLTNWNGADTPYPRTFCVHQRFDQIAARFADRVAVEFPDESLTYAELSRRAEALSRELQGRGLQTGDVVGVCLDRSAQWPVALLAVLKAGAAYLPLDPVQPRVRLDWMLNDVDARLLLSDRSTHALFEGAPRPRLCLHAGAVEGAAPPAKPTTARPDHASGPGDLAYVMYTSGSTGTPKGIGIPHRAILRLVCETDYIDLQPSDRIAQGSNCSFDASTFEIWGALLNGARVVGIAKETLVSPGDLARCLEARGITTLFLTTALFNQVAAQAPATFARLRQVLFGGEHVDAEAVRRVLAGGPPRRLIHVYGPTECTTFATSHPVTEVLADATTVPIGLPIAHTTAYVLDDQLELVPPGVPGELCLGGDGLANGYWNRPGLTAEKFIPDPYSGRPGARLYRTGDLVRRRADGAIEFIGRRDRQVKLRGFRIEPGEIESALRTHPGIAACAVLLREDGADGRRLVVYYVPVGSGSAGVAALRRHLQDRLPEYMLPQAWVPLERLPLTANGKLDEAALPPPQSTVPDLAEAPLSAASPIEQQVASVWEDVLGVEQPGLDSNFFDLGGHSLLLVQVQNRLQRELGRAVSMLDLFRLPTIRALATHLERDPAATPVPPATTPGPRSAPHDTLAPAGAPEDRRQRAENRASRRREALGRFRRGTEQLSRSEAPPR